MNPRWTLCRGHYGEPCSPGCAEANFSDVGLPLCGVLRRWNSTTRSASGSTPSLPSTPPPDRPLSPAGPPVCATSATPGPGLRPPAAPRVAPHLPRRHQRWCPASPPSGGRARHCSLVGRDRRACHAARWSSSPRCPSSSGTPQRAPPSGAPRSRGSPPNGMAQAGLDVLGSSDNVHIFLPNPLGIEGLPSLYRPVQTLVLALGLVAAASVVVGRRGARGIERQQIKWLLYSSVIWFGGNVLKNTVFSPLGGVPWGLWVGYLLVAVGGLGGPISIGIAILRYRLYEVDLLINRTLVYGALTATLVALYFGGIVVL